MFVLPSDRTWSAAAARLGLGCTGLNFRLNSLIQSPKRNKIKKKSAVIVVAGYSDYRRSCTTGSPIKNKQVFRSCVGFNSQFSHNDQSGLFVSAEANR